MSNRKEIIGITLDNKTKSLCDNYADSYGLSRSAMIRMALREFFLKLEAVK